MREFQPKDLVGGHIAVDLVNTVTARDAVPVDLLVGYPRLLHWMRLTSALGDGALAELRALADADPAGAARSLARLKLLREGLHDLFLALIEVTQPKQTEAAAIEAIWIDAVKACSWDIREGRLAVVSTVASSGLDLPTHHIALRAFDLLRNFPTARTRVCAGDRCGWLFIDRSRGGQRRWCDMAVCGNSAKTRRHGRKKKNGRH